MEADAGQLERAFANLLDNARRHGASGTVTVRAKRLRHHLRVRVTDRGPGIPADQLERVFEPFYRAKGAAPGGSGLGLAIARGFVEANGGRLWAESLPGQGTTFVVELPLRVTAARDGPGVSDRRRVLVCDDEPQILRALRVVLGNAGFDVVPAATRQRGARRGRGQAARRRDRRPGAARRRRGRGRPADPRVEPDADHRAVGRRRRGREGPRAGRRRRRLRDQAVRPGSWSRG